MTVYRAKENFDLPELDLLSYLFGNMFVQIRDSVLTTLRIFPLSG
jgi:hypothetical protein